MFGYTHSMKDFLSSRFTFLSLRTLATCGALLGIIGLRYYLIRFGFIYDGFVVPPGGDPAVHIQLAQFLASGHSWLAPGLQYPPGFHLLVVGVANLFHISILQSVTILGQITVVLPILATFIIADKWFNRTVALVATAFIGLASASPVIAYMDGNYPNLIGSSFLMIIGFTYFVESLREKPFVNSIYASIAFILLAFVHHLSFILMLAIIIVYLGVVFIDQHRTGNHLPHFKRVGAFAFVGIILSGGLGWYLFGKASFLPAIARIFNGSIPSFSNAYLSRPLALGEYSATLGPLVLVMGIVGFLLIMNSTSPSLKPERKIFVLTWISVVVILSQLSIIGIPSRLARELAVPFALSGGVLANALVALARERWRKWLTFGIIIIFITSQTTMLTTGPAHLPEGFSQMIWLYKKDLPKIAALNSLPDGVSIVMTPVSPYYNVLVPNKKFVVSQTFDGSSYVFLGKKLNPVPDPIAYPYFANFDTIDTALRTIPNTKIIFSFPDGSEIREVL